MRMRWQYGQARRLVSGSPGELCPHFVNSAGQPDYALMTVAASASGYAEITDANLTQVIVVLEQQATVTA